MTRFRTVSQGASNKRVSLLARTCIESSVLGLVRHRHPIDSGRWQRFVARHPCLKINKHHYAAVSGRTRHFHGLKLPVSTVAVTLHLNG